MTRFLFRIFATAAATLAFSSLVPAQSFPVDHREPITVRILGGKDGTPLPYWHLNFVAGYDRNDLRQQLWHEEVVTDAAGQARVPRDLVNFPWLEVWANKAKLCQANARSESFNIDKIRNEGLSASNECGIVTVREEPGVLAVFVQIGNQVSNAAKAAGGAPTASRGH